MLVDSHCHLNMLDLTPYKNGVDDVIKEAKNSGVDYLLTVGTELDSLEKVIGYAKQYDHVWASVGIHPSEKMDKEPTDETLIHLANHKKVIAIGETGLDYHYNDTGLNVMRDRFCQHIRIARQLNKPLIIHSRDARVDTINLLKTEKAYEPRGVMHCFTEDWAMAKAALDLDFYISISGIVTFKNAGQVQEVAKKVPLNRLLIETDSPYLAPVPMRGKKNVPAYVKYVAEFLAELRGVSFAKIADQTTQNFFDLFHPEKHA